MTDMRRVTVSLPDDLDRRILEMKKSNQFVRCSYSEIVRRFLDKGLEAFEAETRKNEVKRVDS